MSTISASTTSTTAYKVTADTTGTLVLQTGASPTTAVTIDGSQNVGIGTSSPGNKLEVNGAIRSKTSTGGVFNLDSTTTSTTNTIGSYANNGAAFADLNYSGAQHIWLGSGSEKMRIDSSGNLLVGTTSFVNSNTNSTLIAPNVTFIQHISGTASGTAYMNFNYNGSSIGLISQNGTTGVLYNMTSDYRLKNDPQPLTGAKEFVMALQPKKWQWWDGSGEGIGFIAHEFMEVAKYSGNGEKDAVDENGNPVYQSIQPSSSEVMANLISLLQEQQSIIQQLTARIETLEAK